MSFFSKEERRVAQAIGSLNYINPFTPARIEAERIILGIESDWDMPVWHNYNGIGSVNKNVPKIRDICFDLTEKLIGRIGNCNKSPSADDLIIYDNLVLYWLFEKYRRQMCDFMHEHPDDTQFPCYDAFAEDFRLAIQAPERCVASAFTPETIFAICHQINRAFYHIFNFIAGGSFDAAQMRANIWESIFTFDIYRYYRLLFDKMHNVTTLVTGESGTGKELVARAIAFSQYIPFDARKKGFVQNNVNSFKALQLSAMPQSMIESELFGHIKGAYTGAVADHHGYLETCTSHDSIFLDEIGDVSLEVQIKLLRVLQSRTFQRIGDVHPQCFHGKIIAATNRDLHQASENGTFRSDLLYRLCADTISTVPLRRLISGDGNELLQFINNISRRILGDNDEATVFAEEAFGWIEKNLGVDYAWPGNVRELEQCLRNLLIRGKYVPPSKKEKEMIEISGDSANYMSADQVLSRYVKSVFAREKNLSRVAEIVELDRRTVKKYVEM